MKRDTGRKPRRPLEVAGAVAIVAAGAALFAHGLFLAHGGALWRDEVNTATFAAMPSFGAIRAMLHCDSAPLASTLLVRGWTRLFPSSDASLRVLGYLVGIATLAALAWSARQSQVALPICTILLFSLNVWVIRGGDAIRPMGLGMLSIVLAFATLSSALVQPRPWRIALAAGCAVLAVQSIYSNVPLVAGSCIAGIVVSVASRSRRGIAISAAVGALAAVSLLPYVPFIQAGRDWSILIRSRADLAQIGHTLAITAAWHPWAWGILAAVGLGLATGARAGRIAVGRAYKDRALFATVALVAGGLGFCALVVWSRLQTEPWYYLPLIALVSAAVDVLLAPLVERPVGRAVVGGVLIVATVANLFAAAPALRLRQTNVDLVAAKLRESASANDLVIVNPWFYGVTFHRYYQGPSPWTTIPPLEDNSVHRYDLLKRRMQDPGTMDSTLALVGNTLRSGGRIWVMGELSGVTQGVTPQPPPPAPAPDGGWSIVPYSDYWAQQVFALLRDHVINVEPVTVAAPDPVSPYESPPLFLAEGWR